MGESGTGGVPNPSGEMSAEKVRAVVGAKALDDRSIVALCGSQNMIEAQGAFGNSYFTDLLAGSASAGVSAGKLSGKDLLQDPFKQYVEEFANDAPGFHTTFVQAWVKIQEA